jgi:acetyl/propionyl-CoA carboxylase alpha subunit
VYHSLLVANRGEIAARIFRSARAMGLRCIAVYSDVDANAKHVRDADGAERIGPAPARDSYLNAEAIVDAARRSGAEAIHPGYGFLSENPDFAEKVIGAGLVWVGPPAAAIRAMGLKDAARAIAEKAGVPVLPGYVGEDQSEASLKRAAAAIGWPVLIKASAGGGGRGIREVRAPGEFAAALASAKREAAAAFGDDRVLIEKRVARPRHIEVQVFGDAHGGLVHLYERDCSLQRRRQKVIEEAPAPGMTEAVRAALTEAALKLARAVGYQNAGTIEFIADASEGLKYDRVWFLEMNTRLQVEHPVTEAIVGIDLVAWQLKIAAGERLPLEQAQIQIRGHALEARICAEDPASDFRPSAGRIQRMSFVAAAQSGARIDAGYSAGDSVSPFYDNLVAKVICVGDTREDAIAALADGLDTAVVVGPATNTGFVARCLRLPEFSAGAVQTGLITDNLAALVSCDHAFGRAAAVYAQSLVEKSSDLGDPWAAADGWRLNQRAAPSVVVESSGRAVVVPLGVSEPDLGVQVTRVGPEIFVSVEGETFAFARAGAHAAQQDAAQGDLVLAPLPGKVVAVHVELSATVVRGAPVATIEAMKMEHVVKAPRDGIIADLLAAEGAQVKEGQILARLGS